MNLRNLGQREITLIILGATMLAALLWYFFMYRPTQERIAALDNEIAQLDVQIAHGETVRANLPTLREAVAQLEADRRAFLEQLPRENEIAALIDELRLGAENAEVAFDVISRGSSGEQVQDVRPIGISITTTGTYDNTMTFLETLETLRRFTKIGQVSLALEEQGRSDPTLRATYDFTIYVFTGEDPGDL